MKGCYLLIDIKQVITMKIPFPTISSDLATSPHMYICLEKSELNKTFVKCQTLKPHHLGKNKPPFYRIIEKPNINRNPFRRTTLIDCDKLFLTDNVRISNSLLAEDRKDVCDDLFEDIKSLTNRPTIEKHLLESEILVKLNPKIRKVY